MCVASAVIWSALALRCPPVLRPHPCSQAPTSEEPLAERVRPILLKGHTDSVTSAEFCPDGKHVVTASDDRTAIIWDGLTGAPIALLGRHNKALTSAHFDDVSARVVTASHNSTARVWDANSGGQLAIFLGHEDFVNDACFDPGGNRVVTASEDGSAHLGCPDRGVARRAEWE